MYVNRQSDELCHYGRKGMKWGQNIFGKKRGANVRKRGKKKAGFIANLKKKHEAKKAAAEEAKKKKAAEEEAEKNETVEQKKEKILKSRSAKQLYDNAPLFTSEELRDAHNRLKIEESLKSMSPKEVNKTQKFIDDAVKWGDNINKMVGTSKTMYNNAADIYNAYSTAKYGKNAKHWPKI